MTKEEAKISILELIGTMSYQIYCNCRVCKNTEEQVDLILSKIESTK
jgi:hypothetical protein